MQGSGKDLIQPVLDNQLKAASPLLIPPKVKAAVDGSLQLQHSCYRQPAHT